MKLPHQIKTIRLLIVFSLVLMASCTRQSQSEILMIDYCNKSIEKEINRVQLLIDKYQLERIHIDCLEREFSIQVIELYNNSVLNDASTITIDNSVDSIVQLHSHKSGRESTNLHVSKISVESCNSSIDSIVKLYLSTDNVDKDLRTALDNNVLKLDPKHYIDTNYIKLCVLLKTRNFIRIMFDNIYKSENHGKNINPILKLFDFENSSLSMTRNNDDANHNLLLYHSSIIENEIQLLIASITDCENNFPIRYADENSASMEINRVYRLYVDSKISSTTVNCNLKAIIKTYLSNKRNANRDSSIILKNIFSVEIPDTNNESVISLNLLLNIRNCLSYISSNTCTSEMDMDNILYDF